MDEFNKLLLQVIDETIRYSLGDMNAQIIYNYLERKGCSFQEIPEKLDVFVMELENLVGFGRGQILGVAAILENAILKVFCARLKVQFDEFGSVRFTECIKKLKEAYYASQT